MALVSKTQAGLRQPPPQRRSCSRGHVNRAVYCCCRRPQGWELVFWNYNVELIPGTLSSCKIPSPEENHPHPSPVTANPMQGCCRKCACLLAGTVLELLLDDLLFRTAHSFWYAASGLLAPALWFAVLCHSCRKMALTLAWSKLLRHMPQLSRASKASGAEKKPMALPTEASGGIRTVPGGRTVCQKEVDASSHSLLM